MEPAYKDMDFVDLSLGPDYLKEEVKENKNEDQVEFVQPPKRLNTRKPPFEFQIDFEQYRRNKDYKIRFIAYDFVDAFMFQVRGRDRADGNITHLGFWSEVPAIASVIGCGLKSRAAVVDKGGFNNISTFRKENNYFIRQLRDRPLYSSFSSVQSARFRVTPSPSLQKRIF